MCERERVSTTTSRSSTAALSRHHSSEYGTYKTVTSRIRPWLSGKFLKTFQVVPSSQVATARRKLSASALSRHHSLHQVPLYPGRDQDVTRWLKSTASGLKVKTRIQQVPGQGGGGGGAGGPRLAKTVPTTQRAALPSRARI